MNRTIRVYNSGVAIVTGGASGIGKALAEELAKRGCEVVLADLQIESAEKIVSEIITSGGKARAVEMNVTDFPAMERMVRETADRTGRLDFIFNNAGIGIGGNVYHYDGIEDWDKIVDINFRGVVNGVQAAYKIMKDQGFGHIVNTASMAGLMPCPGMVSYAATKHAVVGLSKSLRAESAHLGIRVSVFCPGFVRTAIFDRGGKYGKMLMELTPEQDASYKEMIEKFKPITPEIFAVKALDQVAKNKAIIIVPAWWRLVWWIHRLFPTLGISLAEKSFRDGQKKIGIE